MPLACHASLAPPRDAQQSAPLALRPRWPAVFSSAWSRGGRYLFLTEDDQLLVMDSQTGALLTRIPRPGGRSLEPLDDRFDAEFNLAAGKLLVHDTKGCGNQLLVYDAHSGVLLKSYCGSNWVFGVDGSRLALSLIDPAVKSGAPSMSELIVDACTLAPLQAVAPPTANSGAPRGTINAAGMLSDGVTLAVAWSQGLTLTQLRSGHRQQFPSAHEIGSFWEEAGRIAWRSGDHISVWDVASERARSFDVNGCGTNQTPTLSPDAARLALVCSNFVAIWDATSLKLLERFPVDSPFEVNWLAGGRGLLVQSQNTILKKVVLDLASRKQVQLANADQELESVGLESRLVTIAPIGGTKARERVAYLDEALLPHDLALPDCRLANYAIADAKPGLAVITCADRTGKKAVLFDAKTRLVRSFPISGGALSVEGDTLVSIGLGVELRALKNGARRSGSPLSPSEISTDSWWEGSTFVTTALNGATRRISHFDTVLKSESEAAYENPLCSGVDADHRATLSWNMDPPYTLCDRRTGRAVGNIPSEVANPVAAFVGTADFDVSSDLVLVGLEHPRLFRRADWRSVPLENPPRDARIVGQNLIAGSDDQGQIGVWSADDGRRLARWPRGNTPGQDTDTVYNASDIAPVAADAQRGLLVFGARRDGLISPTVYDLQSGKALEVLPLPATGNIRFIAPGVLSVVEPKQVSFWRVPHAKRLGIWLTHPDTGDVAFVVDSGAFEVSGDASAWRDVLRCERGDVEAPFETCVTSLLEPGIAARTLAFDQHEPP